MPSFAAQHQRKRKLWNKREYVDNSEENQERIHKMDALNLEMSETFKADQFKQALKNENNYQFIEKGRLLDSLDLNTGFEAIQKLKEKNIKPKIKNEETKISICNKLIVNFRFDPNY